MIPPPVRLLAAALALTAAAAPVAAQGAPQVNVPFETYRLENGLRVILAPDPATPVVAVNLWYDVGSRNERAGRTGFAHLFEHMMFEGSENAPKGEHTRLLRAAGATNLNASTSEDRTNYYAVVPPSRMNLALWLEADRMRSLQVTEAQLRNQQEIVKEERRLRVDNAPYGMSLNMARSNAVYAAEGCFPYSHDIIGSMADLDSAQLVDVQQFFRTYYAPNNATLTLVGDFQPDQARQLIQQYFAAIPSAPAPPPVTCENPFTDLPRRDTVRDANATLPAFMASYGAVPVGHADSYPLELLGTIMGGGASSRLNQRLVKQERAASFAVLFSDIRRGPGLMLFYLRANQGVDAGRLESLLDEELDRLLRDGVTEAELERAKNQQRAGFIRGMQTAMGRAETLQEYTLYHGDPARVRTALDGYMSVTREDVLRVARQYLRPDNRAVVVTIPGRTQ
ncbi:MAG TPA: pitrilysin family protein [Longimicrobium sp.]|nr:pitrilysin family protein [Longimicrobium sp.]